MEVNEVVGNDNRVLVRLSFLFLLVCVLNTVGLLLAKFLGKSGEVALRRAMGASRGAVFSQNLVEVGMIGVLGGLGRHGPGLARPAGRGKHVPGYQHLVHLDPVMLITAIGAGHAFGHRGRPLSGVAGGSAGPGRPAENPVRISS